MKLNELNIPRSELDHMIDEWIWIVRNKNILLKKLEVFTYEELAEEFVANNNGTQYISAEQQSDIFTELVARTAGVSGRTVSTVGNVVSNGTEEVVDNLSDTVSDTFCLHPLKGLKSIGSGVIAVGKGATNIVKTTTTGVFGVCYELVDEVKYIIVPNTTNDSALNPDEVLTIQF